MPTSSLLRNSLSVNSRHHRTTSGMTSSSSATSSNSNNLNSDRYRDNSSRSSDMQKAREDDSPKDMNRLNQQNGKKPLFYPFRVHKRFHWMYNVGRQGIFLCNALRWMIRLL